MAAAFEAVPFGRLYYRLTEKDKIEALKNSKGNFDCHMTLPDTAYLQLVWWEQNISESSRSLIELPITDTKFTDASNMGLGASSQFGKINGRWTDEEKDLHINNLELLSIFISLKSFKRIFLGKDVRIMSDSATAIAYVNNMGGSRSITSHKIAKQIWEWAKLQGVWISAAHIPEQKNIEADKKSRQFKDTTGWMLSKEAFSFITK